MHTVAITRWGAPLAQELPYLAELMGMAAYDARLKLVGPLPVVINPQAEADAARAMLDALRRRGHGAVVCERETIPTAARILVPRSFEFNADAFVAIDPAGRRYAVPYAEIIGLIRAAEISTESAVKETVEKKFSARRTVMSGGLIRSKKVVKRERSFEADREQVLYVFRSSMPDPIRLHESGLHYDGLGDYKGATRNASFATVVEWLRGHATGAAYDARLMTKKRRPTGLAVQLTGSDQIVQHSNQTDNDLASYLLMHGHLQRQL